MRNVFFTSHAKNEIGRIVPDLFVFLKKLGTLVLIYLCIPWHRHHKNKLSNISGCWSREIYAQFWFFIKRSGTSFLPYFRYDFPRKVIRMLYSINWPNFIVWLFSLLEILGHMCIAIICCSAYDVINFEINCSFHIKTLFYITQTLGKKCKNLKN